MLLANYCQPQHELPRFESDEALKIPMVIPTVQVFVFE